MNRRKVFVRKTRKGKIQKIVREHYLRNDLWCGSVMCEECGHSAEEAKLDEASQYLVLDTNCFLHQMDALEAESTAFDNVVVLQTVLQELQNRNFKMYSRLRELMKTRDNWVVFCNEHHKHTYIERLPAESPNDRNDRAIRVAALWYNNHLTDANVTTMMLTNDADNKAKATREGLKCHTLADYVRSRAAEFPQLLDKLAQVQTEDGQSNDGFTRHLSLAELKQGLAKGTIFKGTYACSREYWTEAWVKAGDKQVFLPAGRRYFNRAIDGDIVGVQLLPESQWQKPSQRIAPPSERDPQEGADAIAEMRPKDSVPTGRVVGIFERKWRPYCGSLEETEKKSGSVLFVSVNRKVPKIRMESKRIQELMDQRIMVAIDSWPVDSFYPLGHFVKSLGKIGDMDTETEVLLIEHEIRTAPWTVSVLSCLPPENYSIPEDEYARRKDLRGELICSIDPPGCTDIDDALHCKLLPNGNFEVGVHIADVSHFMRPDTPLDIEAAERGTSVYLVQRRIDMIPSLLSTDLCSLHGGVERLAFSCVWELTPDAEIVDTRFHKSVIKNVGAFTYQQAQDRVDEKRTDPISVSIQQLNELAKKINLERTAKGSLSLASTEVKFKLSDDKNPEDVKLYQYLEVNKLVEEFMLLANVSVAKRILECFPTFAMLRRHPVPKEENFLPLKRAAKLAGFEICTDDSKALADSLDKAVIPERPFFNKMIRILTTRCMTQAVYFSSGELAPAEYLHYGLASPIYTHFTSPIRRYADVVVHRLLATSLGIDPLPKASEDKARMKETCDTINHRNRMAQHVGRASSELFTLLYFRDKRVTETAMIIRVGTNGIGVLVEKYGVEGTITLHKDKEDGDGQTIPNPYNYDEENLTLKGEGREFQILDEIKVEIYVKTSKFHRQWLVIDLLEGEEYKSNQNMLQTIRNPAKGSRKKGKGGPATKKQKKK